MQHAAKITLRLEIWNFFGSFCVVVFFSIFLCCTNKIKTFGDLVVANTPTQTYKMWFKMFLPFIFTSIEE
jgi:hypothetical protein